ncbi:MAG: hypothetical protein NZL93_04380, partial [Chthoniobacterales bacterium]|nr:hypothetical protein [Chthoniobacterales bacterium]
LPHPTPENLPHFTSSKPSSSAPSATAPSQNAEPPNPSTAKNHLTLTTHQLTKEKNATSSLY